VSRQGRAHTRTQIASKHTQTNTHTNSIKTHTDTHTRSQMHITHIISRSPDLCMDVRFCTQVEELTAAHHCFPQLFDVSEALQVRGPLMYKLSLYLSLSLSLPPSLPPSLTPSLPLSLPPSLSLSLSLSLSFLSPLSTSSFYQIYAQCI